MLPLRLCLLYLHPELKFRAAMKYLLLKLPMDLFREVIWLIMVDVLVNLEFLLEEEE